MPIKVKIIKSKKHIYTVTDIKDKLLNDLIKIGCPTDFSFSIRGYSKASYAKYDPNTVTVILYPYKDKAKTLMYGYKHILKYTVHEVCHHIQWSDPYFVRIKGVMHNSEFYRIFNEYWERTKK